MLPLMYPKQSSSEDQGEGMVAAAGLGEGAWGVF